MSWQWAREDWHNRAINAEACEKGHRGLASITLTHELAATVDNGQARFATLETQLAAADRLGCTHTIGKGTRCVAAAWLIARSTRAG